MRRRQTPAEAPALTAGALLAVSQAAIGGHCCYTVPVRHTAVRAEDPFGTRGAGEVVGQLPSVAMSEFWAFTNAAKTLDSADTAATGGSAATCDTISITWTALGRSECAYNHCTSWQAPDMTAFANDAHSAGNMVRFPMQRNMWSPVRLNGRLRTCQLGHNCIFCAVNSKCGLCQ